MANWYELLQGADLRSVWNEFPTDWYNSPMDCFATAIFGHLPMHEIPMDCPLQIPDVWNPDGLPMAAELPIFPTHERDCLANYIIRYDFGIRSLSGCMHACCRLPCDSLHKVLFRSTCKWSFRCMHAWIALRQLVFKFLGSFIRKLPFYYKMANFENACPCTLHCHIYIYIFYIYCMYSTWNFRLLYRMRKIETYRDDIFNLTVTKFF